MVLRITAVLLLGLLFSRSVFGLVVLQYHHISTTTPKSTSTSPELFRQHMDYLEEHEFKVIDIRELPAMLKGEASLPNHAVIITFDDGFSSIYDMAFPELKKRNWPFTVFVNSQPHDQKNHKFMSWEQLREIQKAGAVIANHTDSHLHMVRKLEGESDAQFQDRRRSEIEFAAKRLKEELGEAPKFLAYPYGEYDAELIRMLRDMNYLAFGQQSGALSQSNNPQALPRFPFGGPYGTMNDFTLKVNSLPFPSFKSQISDSKGQLLHDPILPDGDDRPILTLSSPVMSRINVSCFASGQGSIPVKKKGDALIVQAPKNLGVGRSRYNCTSPAGGGRFYWFSQTFINKRADGSWYKE